MNSSQERLVVGLFHDRIRRLIYMVSLAKTVWFRRIELRGLDMEAVKKHKWLNAWCGQCKSHIQYEAYDERPPEGIFCPACIVDCEVVSASVMRLKDSLIAVGVRPREKKNARNKRKTR